MIDYADYASYNLEVIIYYYILHISHFQRTSGYKDTTAVNGRSQDN